jgi:hypothetical protein
MEAFTESKVAKFFESDLGLIDRGRNHVKSFHIRDCSKTESKVNASVDPSWGSIKNKTKNVKSTDELEQTLNTKKTISYSVEICFNEESIVSA